VNRLQRKCPELFQVKIDTVRIDTVLHGFDTIIQTDIRFDTAVFHDTVFRWIPQNIRTRLSAAARSGVLSDTVTIDTLGVKVMAWVVNGRLKVIASKAEQTISIKKPYENRTIQRTVIADKPFYKISWFWWFIVALAFFIWAAIRK
jgi:hypothetical protein